MAQDNALKAPAHGFGQEVSFSANIDARGTPMLDGLGRNASGRAGVIGDPSVGRQQRMQAVEAPPADPTFTLLAKAADGLLQQRIKEERTRAFVSGMQRAANGEAIKDIAEGQPWYSRIFGEADAVEGARVYTSQAKAAEVAGAIEDSMAEVRKLDPEAARQHYTELVNRHLTGDDATDATLMQSFARTLPGTMRRQAKEHYAWKQEEASKAESAALLSMADLLQKRATDPKQTQDEYVQQAVQLVAGMRPAQGRDIDSWTKARAGDLVSLAQAGKFHALNTIRSAGMFDMLPPDVRARVESAIDTSENRAVATKSFEYADEIGRIAGEAEVYHDGIDPDRTRKQLAELNDRFRRETGIDRDLISLDKGAGVIKDVHKTILMEGQRRIREGEEAAKAAAKAGDKLAEEALLKGTALKNIGLGLAGAAKRADKVGKYVDDQFVEAYAAAGRAGGPAAQATLLMQNYTGASSNEGYVSKTIVDSYERRLDVAIGQQMPGDFKQLAAEYESLYQRSPALADAYMGKHHERMAAYRSVAGPGMPASAEAYAYAFASDVPRPKALNKDDTKVARKELAALADNPAWKVFSKQGIPLRDEQLDAAMLDLGPLVSKYRSLGSPMDQAVQRALLERQRDNGTAMLGGYYIPGSKGMPSLLGELRELRPGDPAKGTGDDAEEVFGKALQGVLGQRAQAAGLDIDAPVLSVQRYIKDGASFLHFNLQPRDGSSPVPVVIGRSDIKNFLHSPTGRKQGGSVTQ